MHQSAMSYGRLFFNTYCSGGKPDSLTIVEIGSQNVNGSLRDVAPSGARYIGLDFAEGRGVDVVIDDPYALPLPDASADVIVSSSCFEHSEFFWLVFLEAMRILRDDGVFYLNAPSNGSFHRWPVDCWRFYPDSGHALVAWGKRNGYNPLLLESFIGSRSEEGGWNDFVAVFLKEAGFRGKYPARIVDSTTGFCNAYTDESRKIRKYSEDGPDFDLIKAQIGQINAQTSLIAEIILDDAEIDASDAPALWKSRIEECIRSSAKTGIISLWKIFDRLSDIAEENGDVPRAIAWYTQAMKKAGEPVEGNLKLIRLLFASDRFADAIAVLEPYLERFPEDGKAREWLMVAQDARDTLKNSRGAVMPGGLLDYWRWCERRQDDPLTETLHRERIEKLWKKQPLFEILLILEPGQESLLADSIDSLAQQAYTGWRLAIFAQSASPDPEFVGGDGPVRWISCTRDEIGRCVDARLLESPADWFGFFPCGTRFSPETFLTLGDYIAIRPGWTLIHTDDDFVASNGRVHSPRFKPELNLEFLRSTDYVGGFFVEKQTLLAVGGFSTIPGAEAYDLLLRVIDASGEAAIGHISEVLVHLSDSAPAFARDDGAMEALRRHFDRRKIPVSILPGRVAGETRRVVYLHEEKPKVSIIVSTRNRLDLLGPCVETLFEKTFYPNWELLIADNDSDDPAVLAYYDKLCELMPDRVKIVSVPGGFDFSAMNNRAARQARGEYLLLLNNDTKCVHGEWLDAMMSQAQRPDVGLVGARLLFPETLHLQSAGSILGLGRVLAGHVFLGEPHDAPTYMNRALVDQEYTVMTGACLLIRAPVFHQVAGLDPEFKLQNQDTDLCLKIRELGYRVIWTPFATLRHHGSASLKRMMDERKYEAIFAEHREFVARWRHRLSSDPAWNRHLGLAFRKPAIERELVVPWNVDFHDRPRVLCLSTTLPTTVACRGQAPLHALNARGDLHQAVICCRDPYSVPTSIELERLAPDTVLIHAPIDDEQLPAPLKYAKHDQEIFRVHSISDLPTALPENHPRNFGASPKVIMERMRRGLAASHRLIVSTEPLADAFRGMIDDIRVLPDTLEWRIWGTLPTVRRARGKKLRVGWAGAAWRTIDPGFMREIVEATRREVDWIFSGGIPEEIRSCAAEWHEDPHEFEDYPEKLASLDLDLALAPLEIDPFNEATSNLRLLEYGILGWPTICTDIFPYRTGNPPVTRLPNDARQWIAAILARVGEPDALVREGEALRAWVRAHYLLEDHLDLWRDAVLFQSRAIA
ncbi:MAG: glycosyltransferase [Candidatus Accumulibacter sp.]|jgi:GT2 family glycosyltransferase/SAM-dependent methyltransferase|nr:glycosyltransferase [Accumulibacter sp.]